MSGARGKGDCSRLRPVRFRDLARMCYLPYTLVSASLENNFFWLTNLNFYFHDFPTIWFQGTWPRTLGGISRLGGHWDGWKFQYRRARRRERSWGWGRRRRWARMDRFEDADESEEWLEVQNQLEEYRYHLNLMGEHFCYNISIVLTESRTFRVVNSWDRPMCLNLCRLFTISGVAHNRIFHDLATNSVRYVSAFLDPILQEIYAIHWIHRRPLLTSDLNPSRYQYVKIATYSVFCHHYIRLCDFIVGSY